MKEELTGEEQSVAELDIHAAAYIPEKYIEASASRMDCYKQIAEIRSVADYKRVCLSMEENYGTIPPEVLNLLVIAVLKSFAAKFNIRKISVSGKGGRVELPSVNALADGRLAAALEHFPQLAKLEMSRCPAIEFAGGADAVSYTHLDVYKRQGYRYCSYLLYQIVYIGIIAAFMGIYKEKPAQFGWKKTHPKYYLIGIFLLFGLMFSLNYVNNCFVAFLGLFGYTMPESSLPSLAGGGIVGVLFVVAVLPAVLEETLFRGVILEGIKDCGTVAACLLGGLLFCVFHQSPAQTVYQLSLIHI